MSFPQLGSKAFVGQQDRRGPSRASEPLEISTFGQKWRGDGWGVSSAALPLLLPLLLLLLMVVVAICVVGADDLWLRAGPHTAFAHRMKFCGERTEDGVASSCCANAKADCVATAAAARAPSGRGNGLGCTLRLLSLSLLLRSTRGRVASWVGVVVAAGLRGQAVASSANAPPVCNPTKRRCGPSHSVGDGESSPHEYWSCGALRVAGERPAGAVGPQGRFFTEPCCSSSGWCGSSAEHCTSSGRGHEEEYSFSFCPEGYDCVAGFYRSGDICVPCPGGTTSGTGALSEADCTGVASRSLTAYCGLGEYFAESGACVLCEAGRYCADGQRSTPCSAGSYCLVGASVDGQGDCDARTMNTFDASISTGSLTMDRKFRAAAAVGSKVIFAPGNANFVGVFDTATTTFNATVSTGSLTINNKFHGAAAVGSKVVFAPLDANVVGVFDLATNTIDASVSTGSLTMGHRFVGAVAVGSKVVFAPFHADAVGVFDVATMTFDASVSTGSLKMDRKFAGAAAVGSKVVFAPLHADAVGVFDVATMTFDASVSTGSLTMDYKFAGAAAVGSKVVFAPLHADAVGVFDVASMTFDASVSTGSLTMDYKFHGAAAVGSKVVFAPENANAVGVFDVVSMTFDASVSTGSLTMSLKFMGAAAVGSKVVFAPRNADAVGVLDACYGACAPGHHCPEGSPTDLGAGLCDAGYFCPLGSAAADSFPCPRGRWSSTRGLSHAEACEGKCPAGTLSSVLGASRLEDCEGVTCPPGSYCPAGSGEPTPCPAGTYANTTGASNVTECDECPAGRYCADGVSNPCGAGSYCPAGASMDGQGECDALTMNSFDASVSTGSLTMDYKFRGAVAVGSKVIFAPDEAEAVGVVDVASMTFDSSVSTGSLTIGHKFYGAAAVGSKVVFAPWNADAVGVYDVATMTFDASVSTGSLTMIAKFMGAAAVGSKVVFAPRNADAVGVFDVATMTFDASVSTGSLTMDAKFEGAAAMGSKVVFAPHSADAVGVFDVPTMTFDASVSTGSLTVGGKFVGAAAVGTKVVFAPTNADAVGVFDVATMTFDASVSTGSLTMNSKFAGATAVGTKVVFAPHNADVVGVFDACHGACAPGHHCPEGSPTALGVGPCAAGHFCPAGSAFAFPCPRGRWSSARGLSHAEACEGKCPVGTLSSVLGASRVEDCEGVACPPGSYCPAGSGEPTPCPPGMYSTLPGSYRCEACPAGWFNADEGAEKCNVCIAGSYCLAGSTANSQGLCAAGHSCPAGSTTNQGAGPCPKGHFCPPGMSDPTSYPCPAGRWNNLTGVGTVQGCKLCPPGRWGATSGLSSASDCTACSPGTWSELEGQTKDCTRGCPAGTYSTLIGLSRLSDCEGLGCPPGRWSARTGLSDAEQCDGLCPPGRWSATPGLAGPDSCAECPPGKWSARQGLTSAGDCEGVCSAGTYSTRAGVSALFECEDQPCAAGTYSTLVGLSAAEDCEGAPCPAGEWSSRAGASRLEDCDGRECPAGHWCPGGTTGDTARARPCDAGRLCPNGTASAEAAPLCPAGHWCARGATEAKRCPPGRHTDAVGMQTEAECQATSSPCPGGAEACRGGMECGMGYNGTLCGSCIVFPLTDARDGQSYYPLLRRCLPCPEVPWASIAVGVALFVAVCCLFAFTALGKSPQLPWQAVGYMKQIVNFAQQLGLAVQVGIAWPETFLISLEFLNVFSLDLDILSPECYAPMSFHAKFFTKLVVPIAIVALASLSSWVLRRRLNRVETQAATSAAQNQRRDSLVVRLRARIAMLGRAHSLVWRTTSTVLVWMYVPIVLACIDALIPSTLVSIDRTTNSTTSMRVLQRDTAIAFDSPFHRLVMAVAVITLITLIVVVPVVMWRLLVGLRDRGTLRKQETIASFAPLFQMYREKYVWFEVAVCVRKAATTSTTGLRLASPIAHATLLLLTNLAYVVAVWRWRPFVAYQVKLWRRSLDWFNDVELFVSGVMAANNFFAAGVAWSGIESTEQFGVPLLVLNYGVLGGLNGAAVLLMAVTLVLQCRHRSRVKDDMGDADAVADDEEGDASAEDSVQSFRDKSVKSFRDKIADAKRELDGHVQRRSYVAAQEVEGKVVRLFGKLEHEAELDALAGGEQQGAEESPATRGSLRDSKPVDFKTNELNFNAIVRRKDELLERRTRALSEVPSGWCCAHLAVGAEDGSEGDAPSCWIEVAFPPRSFVVNVPKAGLTMRCAPSCDAKVELTLVPGDGPVPNLHRIRAARELLDGLRLLEEDARVLRCYRGAEAVAAAIRGWEAQAKALEAGEDALRAFGERVLRSRSSKAKFVGLAESAAALCAIEGDRRVTINDRSHLSVSIASHRYLRSTIGFVNENTMRKANVEFASDSIKRKRAGLGLCRLDNVVDIGGLDASLRILEALEEMLVPESAVFQSVGEEANELLASGSVEKLASWCELTMQYPRSAIPTRTFELNTGIFTHVVVVDALQAELGCERVDAEVLQKRIAAAEAAEAEESFAGRGMRISAESNEKDLEVRNPLECTLEDIKEVILGDQLKLRERFQGRVDALRWRHTVRRRGARPRFTL